MAVSFPDPSVDRSDAISHRSFDENKAKPARVFRNPRLAARLMHSPAIADIWAVQLGTV
ncbi:hypothetical protein [Bosea sp. 2RAB26]|uniref:hypothetical protein n=1 Tax=Bosea sp. 2RAB26 TaxID=3237476 RepID=UPI003F8E3F4A